VAFIWFSVDFSFTNHILKCNLEDANLKKETVRTRLSLTLTSLKEISWHALGEIIAEALASSDQFVTDLD